MTESHKLAHARRVAKRMGLSVRTVRIPAMYGLPAGRNYQVVESLTGDVVHPFLITPEDVTGFCEHVARYAPRH
jgi:hypothetical protein